MTLVLILELVLYSSVLLLAYLLWKNYKLLAISMVVAALWILSIFLTDGSTIWGYNYWLALYSSRASFIFGILVFHSIIIFVLNIKNGYFASTKKHTASVIALISWCIQILYSFIALGNSVVFSVVSFNGGIASQSGNLASLSTALFSLYLVGIIALIAVQTNKSKDGLLKIRLSYIFIGIVLSAISAVFTNLLLPLLGFPEVRILGPLGLLFFIGFTLYSLILDRLFDPKKFLATASKVFFLGITLFVTVFIVRWTQTNVFRYNFFEKESLFIDFVASNVVALVLTYAIPPIDSFFMNIFHEKQYALKNLLNEIENAANISNSDSSFTFRLTKILLKHFQLANPQIVTITNETSNLTHLRQTIIVQEHKSNLYTRELRNLNIAIIGHIHDDTVFNQQIFLTLDNIPGRAYVREELEVLEAVIEKLRIEYTRLVTIRNTKNFNKLLKEKVEEQTIKLKKAYKDLKSLDNKKSEFMTLASHQLRTPISVLRGKLELLQDGVYGDISGITKTVIGELGRTTRNLADIVTEIFDAVNVERINWIPTSVQVSPLVDEIVQELELKARQKGIELLYTDKTNNQLSIFADREKVLQAIYNLVNNAIAYTFSGLVSVTTEQIEPENVIIRIHDTGIGIAPENIKKLFVKFSRLPNAKKARPDGSGIGLFLTKFYTEQAHGSVWVESEGEGKGSTFYLSLPLMNGKQNIQP